MHNPKNKSSQSRQFVTQSGLATIMKVAASCFALIWTILIARNLPKADAGFIFSFISIYTIASTLARQGSDSTILRYTATEGMKDHRFFRAVAITIGCVAVVTSIGAFFFMPAPAA